MREQFEKFLYDRIANYPQALLDAQTAQTQTTSTLMVVIGAILMFGGLLLGIRSWRKWNDLGSDAEAWSAGLTVTLLVVGVLMAAANYTSMLHPREAVLGNIKQAAIYQWDASSY